MHHICDDAFEYLVSSVYFQIQPVSISAIVRILSWTFTNASLKSKNNVTYVWILCYVQNEICIIILDLRGNTFNAREVKYRGKDVLDKHCLTHLRLALL